MQEVDFASLKAREAAPDPTSSACGADMELYMRDCRRLLELGLKRWGGDAPERLGPRVLNPDDPHDRDSSPENRPICVCSGIPPNSNPLDHRPHVSNRRAAEALDARARRS